jgi:GNAT superfamily N-acetyltransferase
MIRQPWHPPYYRELCERAGLEKAMDLLMWQLEIADREQILPVIFELAERCEPDHGIRLRHMSRRTLRRDMNVFAEIYNQAWARNWGFVPYDKADLDAYAQELQLVFDPDWFMVSEQVDTGEPVAIAITVPDINQVLKKMNGRILPFGWWHFLRRRRTVDRCRVGFLGVKPEFQNTGVAAQLYIEHFDMAVVSPVTWGEMGWILETNIPMNRGMEAMGGRVVKRYRMYERRLEHDAPPAYPADAKVWEPTRELEHPAS